MKRALVLAALSLLAAACKSPRAQVRSDRSARTCASSAECAADQRCVKEGAASVCRAVTDADMTEKTPPF